MHLELEALPVKDQPWIQFKVVLELFSLTKTLVAHLNNQDIAHGKYDFDAKNQMLVINFDGLTGPDTSGGFNNDSLKIFISEKQYTELLAKPQRIAVSFRTAAFYDSPMAAILSSSYASNTKKDVVTVRNPHMKDRMIYNT